MGAALLCVAYGLRSLVASYYASRPGPARIAGLEKAAALVPENWRYNLDLGEIRAAFGEHEAAIDLYRAAIANYPACAVCWMSLAEAQAALHQDPSAAIENAVTFGRSHPTTRLRAATLYAMLGRDDEAGREFAAAQHGLPQGTPENQQDRDDFYATLHRLYSVDFLLDHVIDRGTLGNYFGFVLRRRPLEDARSVWERVRRDGAEIGDWQRVAFAQMLLGKGRVHEAWQVRFPETSDAEATLVDGSFEDSKDHKPFGWYLTPGDGIRAQADSCEDCPDGSRALHLVFDGKNNPRYGGVWQDVPVQGGSHYRLSGKARAQHITSASGPRVAVRGLAREGQEGSAGGDNCGLWVTGPEWKLASPWRDFQIDFDVPDGCEGVRVLVFRSSTDQLNKFLGGELWIDSLSLVPVPAAAPVAPIPLAG